MHDSEILLELIENYPELLVVVNENGNVVLINDAWTTLLGYSKEELFSKPIVAFVHPEDVEATTLEIKALIQGTHTTISFRNRYRRWNGTYVWITWGATAKAGKIFAVGKDITETEETEAFFHEIENQAKIGGWAVDLVTQKTSWSAQTFRLHDLPPSTLIDQELLASHYPPDDLAKMRAGVRRCLKTKLPFDEEVNIVTAKGRHVPARVTGHPVVDYRGEVIKLIGTLQDISVYKKVSDRLEKTASQLEDILESSPGMVYQFQRDPNGDMFFTYCSRQTFDIYEIDADDFRQDPSLMVKMVHPDDQTGLIEKIEESGRALEQFEWDGRIVSATGKTKWIKAKSIPRALPSGAVRWNGLVVDVTREKELELDLGKQREIAEHSARLASVGELAAGVGHEINNPLAIAMGISSRIMRRIPVEGLSPDELIDLVQKQHQACLRIKKIVDGLRTLAHKGEGTAAIASLTESVKTTSALIEEIYAKEGLNVHLMLPDSECFVGCSPTRIQQVFTNLMTNAKDALREVENPKITVKVSRQGEFWQLTVADNGNGIPKDIQDKVFTSFFTTKEVGAGTGIGLSISRSIAESCGGAMSFDSSPSGTAFYVLFPARTSLQAEPELSPQTNALPDSVDAPLNVLVVDDEAGIREILSDLLKELRCNVIEADSAEAALKEVIASRFDLIVTDIKMPGMDGLSLLSEIATSQLAPHATKVVITGGVLEDLAPSSNDFRLGTVDAYLNKPFEDGLIREVVELASKRRLNFIRSA